jgi:hypothetical protein
MHSALLQSDSDAQRLQSVKMMSKKQWLALLTLFTLYVLLGAAVFHHIESNLEVERRVQERNERLEIHGECSVMSDTRQVLPWECYG